MTLIVGVLCQDGVVVGADGAASLGAGGTMTAAQPTRKLSIIRGNIIFGPSGSVGLAQRIEAQIDKKHQHLTTTDANQGKEQLRKDIWDAILKQEFEVSNCSVPAVGRQVAFESSMGGYILAYAAKGTPCLVEFNHTFCPESATANLPFVSVGSGKPLADPFLAFIRRIFWPNRLPMLPEGEFAVWWTLHHTIQTATGGISDPKQIMVLRKDGGADFKPKELVPKDTPETEEAVLRVEAHLQKFELNGTSTGGSAPPIPVPNK